MSTQGSCMSVHSPGGLVSSVNVDGGENLRPRSIKVKSSTSTRAPCHIPNIKHFHDLGTIGEPGLQLVRHVRRIQLATYRIQNRFELNLEHRVRASLELVQLVQKRERVRQ